LTLRVMYQAHRKRHDIESMVPSEIQMHTIDVEHTPGEDELTSRRFEETRSTNIQDLRKGSVGRSLTDDTMVSKDIPLSAMCDQYTWNTDEGTGLRVEAIHDVLKAHEIGDIKEINNVKYGVATGTFRRVLLTPRLDLC